MLANLVKNKHRKKFLTVIEKSSSGDVIGCSELVLKSLGKNPIAADLGQLRLIVFLYTGNGMFCILIGIASMRRF